MIDETITAPVPPAGGEPAAYIDPMAFENFKYGKASREWMWAKPDAGLCPVYSQAHVTRLQAEVKRLKKLLGQASGMVNGATAKWHDQVAKELRP